MAWNSCVVVVVMMPVYVLGMIVAAGHVVSNEKVEVPRCHGTGFTDMINRIQAQGPCGPDGTEVSSAMSIGGVDLWALWALWALWTWCAYAKSCFRFIN